MIQSVFFIFRGNIMKDKLKQSVIAITSANLKRLLFNQKLTQRELSALTVLAYMLQRCGS